MDCLISLGDKDGAMDIVTSTNRETLYSGANSARGRVHRNELQYPSMNTGGIP